MPAPKIHNADLAPLIRDAYTPESVQTLWAELKSHGSLRFPTVPGRGLFRAALTANTADGGDYTGYDNAWVRDTVHVAHALLVQGQGASAAAAVLDVVRFWLQYRHRWTECIAGTVDWKHDPTKRPHIRFNGGELRENDETWAHAQNDAIGYTAWLLCLLAEQGHVDLMAPLADVDGEMTTATALDMLVLIALYLSAVSFWADDDSGHWEEARKVEASSIGAATAGLRDLEALLDTRTELRSAFDASFAATVATVGPKDAHGCSAGGYALVSSLVARGKAVLAEILPYESRGPAERVSDGAQLFLVYPLDVVEDRAVARAMVERVISDLAGDYGIRRYRGDSYWAADYKKLFSESTRTADFSDDLSARDAKLKPGQEAQWCIFDSIVSCIYARWARDPDASADQRRADLATQLHFFNRAVGQITGSDCAFGAWHCPESYYIEDGKYVSNDVCPLLWTGANLVKALVEMTETVSSASSSK
ncbi:Six-hairpin glycosidase-like protein [Blastocladiella britannica]|nr:Six-hairpin glycosidase-like protein [Blastocladiella britannica]